MDKCLVTKLGASVSGDFPKLGELIIDISTVGLTPTSSDTMYFVGSEVELRGGIQFSDGTTTGADSAAHKKYLKPDQTGQLVVKNKYGLTEFNITISANTVNFVNKVDIKELAYNSGLVNVRCADNKLTGDIACLAGKKLTQLRVENTTSLEGDIVAFAEAFHNAILNGRTLSNFSLRANSNITGSIEDLVHAVRALGSADESGGNHSFNVSGTQVTFNGSTIPLGSGLLLSWTENSITYNNVTIPDTQPTPQA